MNGKDKKLMSIKEADKYEVIQMVIEKRLKQKKAAQFLSLSTRQVRRLVKEVKSEGKQGLIHGLRGRKSNKRIDTKVKKKILYLRDTRYPDFTLTLMQEKLKELDDIVLGRETLRQMLLSEGKWSLVRKHSDHKEWRERMETLGEMAQLDGSVHDWLEGRGPEMVLMGFIDDATNIVFAEFFEYEGTIPALTILKKYIKKYGIPRKIYLDRHGTYKSKKEATVEEQLKGENPMSQFERAAKELEIEVIHAYSPQAKGRIERSFRTHQDRLVKEMRLANVCTLDEANKFLKNYYLLKHNRKFSVRPAKKANSHIVLGKKVQLNRIIAIKTLRTVKNDYTIQYEKNLYQLETKKPLKRRKVTVIEDLKGRIFVDYKEAPIKCRKIKMKTVIVKEKSEKIVRKHKVGRAYKPAKNHPWLTGDSWEVRL
jgi:hypothetical protein